MDNLDDSEAAKISDSAYSNSCSNSQSRRSHSTKSTHSGSNSSGSSGYGGQPSGYSTNTSQPPIKAQKKKESKKKIHIKSKSGSKAKTVKIPPKCDPPAPVQSMDEPKLETMTVALTTPASGSHAEKCSEAMEIACIDRAISKDETGTEIVQLKSNNACRQELVQIVNSFSCVISMHDGVVTYTTSAVTALLGYPKEMWIGRSFLDFVHQKDRNIFASQISNGLAVPKNVNGMQLKAAPQIYATTSMVCRLRRYRGLRGGFAVKDHSVTFMPFQLKFAFKKINDDDGDCMYLVIQATPFYTAFRVPYELIPKAVPFTIRHAANGMVEYVDPESVPYLGYLPQDLVDKCALEMYHPHDLDYMQHVYETIVREGSMPRGSPFRMMVHNGDYIKLETEWSSFINPWSRKLEFVIGKHHIVEGPRNPEIFQEPNHATMFKLNEDDRAKTRCMTENIVRIMNEVPTKPALAAKKQMTKRCQDLAAFMEVIIEETSKNEEVHRLAIKNSETNNKDVSLGLPPQPENRYVGAASYPEVCERNVWSNAYYTTTDDWSRDKPQELDSIILGGISPHHDYNDSKSSTDTRISYNQLNYNDNLQRYFDYHQPYDIEEIETMSAENLNDFNELKPTPGKRLSPFTLNSSDSDDHLSFTKSRALVVQDSMMVKKKHHAPLRLTESLLSRHNEEMAKELMKSHREMRPYTKSERERAVIENRKKKKEHLARCNATFQPTSAGVSNDKQYHGIKRTSMACESETEKGHKQRCTAMRPTQLSSATATAAVAAVATVATVTATATATATATVTAATATATAATTAASTAASTPSTTPIIGWPLSTSSANQSAYMLGMHIPQPMPLITPVSTGPRIVPMYYPRPHVQMTMSSYPSTSQAVPMPVFMPQQASMPCVVFEPRQYSTPFVYNPMSHNMVYTMPQNRAPQNQRSSYPLSLGARNFEEACNPVYAKASMKTKQHNGIAWRKRLQELYEQSDAVYGCRRINTTPERYSRINALRNTAAGPKWSKHMGAKEDIFDKTDAESSSYSSFYSSFFKTDSGSAEDSDAKKSYSYNERSQYYTKGSREEETMYSSEEPTYSRRPSKFGPKRKMTPPWMETVCVTPDLIYKYQITHKSVEEVLSSDKLRMQNIEQHLALKDANETESRAVVGANGAITPTYNLYKTLDTIIKPSLVNEQLGQLYLDLQLEGVAARLSLEEGITSSGSSGEDTASKPRQKNRSFPKKREYSKLGMIYEEDAPFPPPDKGVLLSPI